MSKNNTNATKTTLPKGTLVEVVTVIAKEEIAVMEPVTEPVMGQGMVVDTAAAMVPGMGDKTRHPHLFKARLLPLGPVRQEQAALPETIAPNGLSTGHRIRKWPLITISSLLLPVLQERPAMLRRHHHRVALHPEATMP